MSTASLALSPWLQFWFICEPREYKGGVDLWNARDAAKMGVARYPRPSHRDGELSPATDAGLVALRQLEIPPHEFLGEGAVAAQVRRPHLRGRAGSEKARGQLRRRARDGIRGAAPRDWLGSPRCMHGARSQPTRGWPPGIGRMRGFIALLGGSRVQIGGPAGAFIVIVYGIVDRYGVSNLLLATAMSECMAIGAKTSKPNGVLILADLTPQMKLRHIA